jgi:CheY-like chemotaxis protein
LPLFEADATQIRQIILNLIINAAEACAEKAETGKAGLVTVMTGVRHCDRALLDLSYLKENLSEGQYVYLEVADSGVGMDETTLARIFDPFFSTKFTGRGLGLAAVLGIMRGHKGAMIVRSQPGHGTNFTVLFPAIEQAPVPAVLEAAHGIGEWRGHGVILIADDEPAVLNIAQLILEAAGFQILTAGDGHEAVETYAAHAPQIRAILLDVTMPFMDGREAFSHIRRANHAVPIIITSGYSEQQTRQDFPESPHTHFIQKPYRANTLLAALRQVLEDQAASTAPL